MTTSPLPDLLYVVLFALAVPWLDHAVFWPAHRRLAEADAAWSRVWLCAWTIGNQWVVVASGVALWLASGRAMADLGFTVPQGWRLWVAVAGVLLLAGYQSWAIHALARSPDQRAGARRQLGPLEAILPHTRRELRWFGGLSVTAGFCEEFLYRGYFVWVFAPWLGWWGAAALSLPFFALAHLYQGRQGMLRSAAMGAIFTLVVAVFESLWPAVVLHALIDFGSGAMAWAVLRETPAQEASAAD